MTRLSDLIKQGKIPEKKQNEEVKMRNRESLAEELTEMGLPTEVGEDELLYVHDAKALEDISLPIRVCAHPTEALTCSAGLCECALRTNHISEQAI